MIILSVLLYNLLQAAAAKETEAFAKQTKLAEDAKAKAEAARQAAQEAAKKAESEVRFDSILLQRLYKL